MFIKMEKNKTFVFVAVILSLLIKESQSCFTRNETYRTGAIKRGDPFYAECNCEHPKLSIKNLKWLDPNDQEIQPTGPGTDAKAYTEWSHQKLSLYIPHLNKLLAGPYKCVSVGDNGQIYAIIYEVEVYEPLYFVRLNLTQYLISGRDSFLFCEARGDTTPHISWYKGQDDTVITSNDKYDILPVALGIKNTSKEDAGEYRCTARVINTGEDKDVIIKAEVMTPPTVIDVLAILDTVVIEGETLTLDCKADGYPLPTYTWIKINQTESPEKNKTWRQEINKIIFDNVTMDDQGTYECITYNQAGEARKNISIEVLAPPTIKGFENITVAEGSLVTITCEATGRPQPYINVTYYGPESESPPGYNTTDDDPTSMALHLTFEKVQRFHEGLYDCNASNSVGSDTKSLYLTVLFKPYFERTEETVWAWEEKKINLSCDHNSQPPALVSWRYHGNINEKPTAEELDIHQFWSAQLDRTTEHYVQLTPVKNLLYGTYECFAKNHLGEARKIFHVKKGFRPPKLLNTNITNVAATSASFNIDLEGTNHTGPPIIGFVAEYDQEENYNITDIHMNRTWAAGIPYKIEKLKPITKYLIRFAAINEIGYGPFGEYHSFETPEKSVPEPPSLDYDSEPVAIPADNKILKLKSPEHNGAKIDYYAIKYCPLDGVSECLQERIPPTTELQLNHLNHNTSYRLEMVAHNSVGNSTPTSLQITIEDEPTTKSPLTAGPIIGISMVVVIIVIVLLDLLLLITRKQGMIATCCFNKNNKKKKEDVLQSKDKKGLLKDNGESTGDTLKRPDNEHKEFEYNKTTGVITGKHSAV